MSVGYGQGTGFYLKGIGLITNYHVLEYVIEAIEEGFKIAGKPLILDILKVIATRYPTMQE